MFTQDDVVQYLGRIKESKCSQRETIQQASQWLSEQIHEPVYVVETKQSPSPVNNGIWQSFKRFFYNPTIHLDPTVYKFQINGYDGFVKSQGTNKATTPYGEFEVVPLTFKDKIKCFFRVKDGCNR